MSYMPLKVRYGTAVEPQHTLSLYYHSFGQAETSSAAPVYVLGAGLLALAVLGSAAQKRSMRTNRRRPHRSRRRS